MAPGGGVVAPASRRRYIPLITAPLAAGQTVQQAMGAVAYQIVKVKLGL